MPLTYWWIPYTLILGTYYSNLNTIMYLGKLTNVLMHWPSWILTLHFLWGRYPLSYNSLAIMIWSLLSIEKVTAAIWMKHVVMGHFHFIATKMDGWSFIIHSMSVALENTGNANMSNITVNCYVGNFHFPPLFPI